MPRFSIAAGAAVFTVAFSQIAYAADLPTKAPVVKTTQATSWTGLYVNGGIGFGIWSADTTTSSPVTGNCITCVAQTQGGKGWLGVVGLGYDYQFVSNFVAGVFGDVNFGSLKGTLQDPGPLFAGETKEQWSWSAGARIGWLVTPDALIYLNGGYTSARFSGASMLTTQQGVVSGFSTPAVTTHGGFVGIGTEKSMTGVLGLGPGWFWRSEYRYASYDSKTLADSVPGGGAVVNVPGLGGFPNPQANINFKPVVQTVTSQIVYKLNTGGPTYNAAPMPAANWNGFYVNGGIGYGGWVADTTTLNPTTGACALCVIQTQGGKGWLGVVGGGFDYQMMPSIVAGIFGDANFGSLKGTIQDQFPGFVGEIREQWSWAAGARAGWLVTPQVLSYWNVGFTSARFSSANMVVSGTGAASGFSTPAVTANGWFIGGGLEAAITQNVFWRTEYRYSSYDTKTLTDTFPSGANPVNVQGVGPVGNPASSITFKPQVQTVTTQLVYKFNWWR